VVRSSNVVRVHLFALGSRGSPRPPRVDVDVEIDPNGLVVVTEPPTGASTFADRAVMRRLRLTGHLHRLSAGSFIGDELAVVADGSDVGGPHSPSHHTIWPSIPITYERFAELYLKLPWQYWGIQK